MPSTADQAPPGSPNPFASGVLFAKRKKNIFKGPTLNFGSGSAVAARNTGSGSHSRNASGSALGRRSGEITIQEEDEDRVPEEEEEDIVEEVDRFTPVVTRPGETVEEQIIEDDEPTPTKGPGTPTPAPKTNPMSTAVIEENTPTTAEARP